jgi:hypothetical protein
MLFASLNHKKIQADFNGGSITSDAGALLLRELDKRISLTEAISSCIPDPRHPLYTVHQQKTMLFQRIFGIALGYEDLNDHQSLRNDPLFQIISERGIEDDQPGFTPPTLCRLENRVTGRLWPGLGEVFVETFIRSYKKAPDELILDFDATDDLVYGKQEMRFFHGYYDHYCFLPLYVFCGSQLLTAYLRPSNIDGAMHSRAILKLLVERLRLQWPNTRIIFRGDSGFCRWRLMRWCDKHNVGYIIGLSGNDILYREAISWIGQSAEQFKQTGIKQRIFGQFMYAAQTWDSQRRIIVKAEHLIQGANTRFIVTNLEGEPQNLYDELYCQRGEAENRIKEQQLGLFSDRTSCHDFVANQFRVFICGRYILMDTLLKDSCRYGACQCTELMLYV